MLSGVPNLAFCVGYTNASWTLRADLASQYVCRLLNHLDRHGIAYGAPAAPPAGTARPLLDLTSGYVQRAHRPVPQAGRPRPVDGPAELRARPARHAPGRRPPRHDLRPPARPADRAPAGPGDRHTGGVLSRRGAGRRGAEPAGPCMQMSHPQRQVAHLRRPSSLAPIATVDSIAGHQRATWSHLSASPTDRTGTKGLPSREPDVLRRDQGGVATAAPAPWHDLDGPPGAGVTRPARTGRHRGGAEREDRYRHRPGRRRAARLLAGHPGRPPPRPALQAPARTDLAVVGGGYTGLWTALLAKERDPGRDVVLLEGDRIGWAASGRNGGFCAASLTHGEANGRERFPTSTRRWSGWAWRTSTRIEATVGPLRHRLRLPSHRRAWTWRPRTTRSPGCASSPPAAAGEFLDRDAVRAEVGSPTYLAGVWDREGTALVDPAAPGVGPGRGGRGGRGAGARAHAGASASRGPARGWRCGPRTGATVQRRPGGAGHQRLPVPAAAAAAAHGPGLRLRADDRAAARRPSSARSAGRHRQGIGDSANQFHYYRLTADNRILWGGYDAIYHFGAHGPPRLRPAPGDVPHCSPGTSSRPSPSWRGCASPTGGAARSTPAPASARSTARRSPGARPTRSATPGSASGPAGSAPT